MFINLWHAPAQDDNPDMDVALEGGLTLKASDAKSFSDGEELMAVQKIVEALHNLNPGEVLVIGTVVY